jgi:hypothetical protein
MKISNLSLLALSASVISARFVEPHEKDQVVINAQEADSQLYLIELAPGETQWVTEEEKWELRRVCRQVCRYRALLTGYHRMAGISWTLRKRLTLVP